MGTVKPWMALTLITPFEASPVLISVDVIGMPWSERLFLIFATDFPIRSLNGCVNVACLDLSLR